MEFEDVNEQWVCDNQGMKQHLPPWLHVLGANKREWKISIVWAFIGFIIVSLAFPPRDISFDAPYQIYQQINAARNAGYAVVALVALPLAVNAYRDKAVAPNKRDMMLCWCIALCIWMLTSVVGFFSWWVIINPELKPSWFH